MKLKKIVSLVLVFAMMVTVFSAVSVSSDTTATAKLSFVSYNANGSAVEGNLETGKVYLIGVQLTDISEKCFKSAQVAVHFDNTVLQLVDENGKAASDYDVVVERTDLYDSKNNKNGHFNSVDCKGSNENGLFTYAIGMDKSSSLKEQGVSNDGKFEIVKFRVKTLKKGKTDLSLATSAYGEGEYDPSNDTGIIVTTPSEATVAFTAPVFRVGNISYVSGTPETVSDKNVALGTSAADVVKVLPSTVKVEYTDDESGKETKDSSVTWTAPASYDASKAGTYIFTGSITTPENYTGAVLTVNTSVVVSKLKVKADTEIKVNAKSGSAPVLPSKVEAELENGTKTQLSVKWDAVADTTGTKDVNGAFQGTDNIDVNGKKAIAHVTFAAAATESTFKTITTDSAAKVDVDVENIESAAAAVLPSAIYGTDSKDNSVYKDVTWTKTSETPANGYKVGFEITFVPKADGFDFGTFTVTVTVSVPDGKTSVTFDKNSVEVSYKDNAGITLKKIIESLSFNAEYADESKVTVSGNDIDWSESDSDKFNASKAGVYTIGGIWTDKYENKVNVTLTVKIENSGATKVEIKNSTTAVNPITSLTMGTLSAKTLYAVVTPSDSDDTVTWTSSNTTYATVSAADNGRSATIKTKNSSGKVTITAKATSGVYASLTLYVNANNSVGGSTSSNGAYKGNGNSGTSLLPSVADDIAAEDVIKSSPFSDLTGYNWAATQIETIRLLGIVSGKTDKTFAPGDNVTRAEFLAMLVRLFDLKAGNKVKEFTDVSAGEWFYETVKIASSLGIAYGYENGAFDPNAVITREDMAVFAKRALEAAGIDPSAGLTSVFSDAADISDYAYDAVDYMTGVGVINGMGDGTFMPRATATRAQAAVVIYNLYIKK